MTTFAAANIPSNIVTVEQLHLWSGLVLRAVNGSRSVVEVEGLLPERVAQVPIIESPNDGIRHLVRVSIEMDPTYDSDKTKKLWMFAKELTQGGIPATYTAN